MFKKMLVAFDGSEGAKRALAVGIRMAQIHQAELWALAVEEKLPKFSGTIDEVQEEKEFATAITVACWKRPAARPWRLGRNCTRCCVLDTRPKPSRR